MSVMISEACVNCEACILECPNEAIAEGELIYEIDPTKCTECVGHFGEEQCQLVCPAKCCVIDPNNIETEPTLVDRAREIHGAENIEEDYPSHFTA